MLKQEVKKNNLSKNYSITNFKIVKFLYFLLMTRFN
jgi:hypothetical protein